VVVGAKGVVLAQALDVVDEEITKCNSQLLAARRLLESQVPAGVAIESFLALAPRADIEAAINDATVYHLAAAASAAIQSTPLLEAISLPELPIEFADVLKKTLATIAAEARRRVSDHVATHALGDRAESWISEGMDARGGDWCPFCGVILTGNSLIAAYEAFFGEGYRELTHECDTLASIVSERLSSAAALTVLQRFGEFEKRIAFWRAYASLPFEPPAALAKLPQVLGALREESLALTTLKQQAPLERIVPGSGWLDAVAAWAAVRDSIIESMNSLATLNAQITNVKSTTATSDEGAALRELRRLQVIRARFQPATAALCDAIAGLEKEKATLVAKKEATKALLDSYDTKVLKDCEKSINGFLEAFGASFRLTGSGKNYVGKAPQSVFGIQFDGHTVKVATKPTGTDPSFRTTMSAGDKNTLALAFFLAQLESDVCLADSVVVFDDLT
jgi:wobble nucleotide-excising tRNase